MNILVAGGAGYIGTHTCVELLKAGHSVIIADNLSNSDLNAVYRTEQVAGEKIPFYCVDITKQNEIEPVFRENHIDGIIHFAGLKAVGESVEKPVEYYWNNLNCTLMLCRMMKQYHVKHMVFSSSATVYGENTVPFTEDMPLLPTTNPYGETKAIGERMLKDFVSANKEYSVALLRYFNPIGAHESGMLGENPKGIPNNLMPYISQVAAGKLEYLNIYGTDYPTKDGTGVRDYIHVVDLAKGHVKAIEKISEDCGVHIYNLGTGKGVSVLELVRTFEAVNGVSVPFKLADRRPGDIARCFAGVEKAKAELGWIAEKSVDDMCRDTWRWEQYLNTLEEKKKEHVFYRKLV